VSPTGPTLTIRCSSAKGQARLDRAAAEILGRMPLALAERLARSVIVFALDNEEHGAFCQGLGSPQDATAALARERVRQGPRATADDELTVIVLALRPLRNLARTLAHELGHVACGHTSTAQGAAAPLSDEELTDREQQAEAFASLYAR